MQEAATQRNGMRWMSWRQTSDSSREDGGPMTTCNPSSQTYTGAKPQIPSLVTCFHGVCGTWTEVTSVMGGFWSERDRDANNVFTQRGNAVVAASHSKAQASPLQGGRSTYCLQKVPYLWLSAARDVTRGHAGKPRSLRRESSVSRPLGGSAHLQSAGMTGLPRSESLYHE